jgi:predicted nucleic acid-binding protein
MTRKKPSRAWPSAGERVVLDANVVIDLLLAELMSKPTPRAQAARRVLALCCVACFSDTLWREVIQNCHKRSVPMPRAAVFRLVAEFKARQKIVHLKASQIDGTPLAKEVLRHAPPEDLHVVRLALAANARWIFTADEVLIDSASRFHLTPPVRVESPDWVLEEIAEPESPCPGAASSEESQGH